MGAAERVNLVWGKARELDMLRADAPPEAQYAETIAAAAISTRIGIAA